MNNVNVSQYMVVFVITLVVLLVVNVVTYAFINAETAKNGQFVATQKKIRRAILTAALFFLSTTLLQVSELCYMQHDGVRTVLFCH